MIATKLPHAKFSAVSDKNGRWRGVRVIDIHQLKYFALSRVHWKQDFNYKGKEDISTQNRSILSTFQVQSSL